MGWYTDNLGDTAENRARDGMSVSENFANSAASGSLSGYAQDYASARGSGASDTQAHDYATGNSGGGSYSTFNNDGSVSSHKTGDNSFSRIFFPDLSDYFDTNAGLLGNNLNANSYPGASRGIAQPAYNHYRVDENGNIVKTQATGDLSSLKAASPTTNPETGINNNNYFNGQGYAYTDKYGFPHVVNDYQTALDYSGNGDIASYQGAYGGGYALGEGGSRVFIPLPGAVQYGNNDGSKTTATTSSASSSTSPTTDLSTTLNADRARALANMLQSRTTAQTATTPTTEAEVEAQMRKMYGDAFVDNMPYMTKLAVFQGMLGKLGGAY